MRYLADRVYDSIEPLQSPDAQTYINAIGEMTREIESLIRDDDDGNPGWSIILDADRCPVQYLPWLAQIVGVTIPGGLSESDQRTWIKSTYGWKRGTVESIKNAPLQYLTGTRRVILRERSPDAYSFVVITRTSETPDPAAAEAALLRAKPAGLNMVYLVHDGQDYEQIFETYATYQAVYDAYTTYQGVLDDELGA